MHKRGGERREAIKSLNRKSRDARTRRHPAPAADARPGAHGPLRVSVISRWSRRPRLGVGNQGEGSFGRVDARQRRSGQALGDGGFHLERASRARTGRGFARLVSGGVQAGHGGAGGDARRCRRARARALGRRTCEPRPARDRHSLRAGRRGTRPLRLGARKAHRQLPRRRSAVRARPSRHSAVWLRARAFRLSRQVVRAGHRGKRRRRRRREPASL